MARTPGTPETDADSDDAERAEPATERVDPLRHPLIEDAEIGWTTTTEPEW